jgi:23S rRNA (adenine1618-N6)-methyltransferase
VVTVKSPVGLHPKNKHQGRYDFNALVMALPALGPYVIKNPRGDSSIDFADPVAVKLLNKALLAYHYRVTEWDIPVGYLCPPIPGRADYIHRLAALLGSECRGLKHPLVNALDVGMGANCIYPIIGRVDYGWQFVASDVDPVSVESASDIVANNAVLKDKVSCRLQPNSAHFFQSIIQPGEFYDITLCNPPFHKSLKEAQQGSQRKLDNLSANRVKRGQSRHLSQAEGKQPPLNFGGQKAELWCPGGEAAFVNNMAQESKQYAAQVLWFSTLISKKENVAGLCKALERLSAAEVRIVDMSQGQKVSRFVAWSFKTDQQRQKWLALKR